MGFYEWKNEFSVNNQKLDRQHKIFLDALDNIHSHIGNIEAYQYLKESITFLGHYIDVHFFEEEELLATIGYPHLERQRRQHEFFRARIAELEDAYLDLKPWELDAFLVLMRDWLLNHILESDQDYARFVSGEEATRSVCH